MPQRELITVYPEANPEAIAGTIRVLWPNGDWGACTLSCEGVAVLSADQVIELIGVLLQTLKADYVGAG